MIKFKLTDERTLNVEAFTYRATYTGFIGDTPSIRVNTIIVERAGYPKEWGDRRHLKILPDNADIETRLKPACFSALLKSSKIFNSENWENETLEGSDGSSLIVTWFGSDPESKTFAEIFEEIAQINWDEEAENFNY